MITAEEVREKSKYFTQIQEQEQLKKEEEQLEEIQKKILEAIERNNIITTLKVDCLYKNNMAKLKELGFSCEIKKQIFDSGYYYEISWAK